METKISSVLLLYWTVHLCLSGSDYLPAVGNVLENDDLAEQVTRTLRAVKADGYDIVTVYATDLSSGVRKRLTRRDVEDHASHPSTESRNFELRLTSGEPLRMSLQKRSAMSPDVRVVERVSGREEIRRPQIRDCFFSGGLQGEEGHASLSLCDGQVRGSIHARRRDYELHALRETAATRGRHETKPVHALLTWSDSDMNQAMDGDIVQPEMSDDSVFASELQMNSGQGDTKEQQPRPEKRATVEVGVYLDRFFLQKVEENLGLNTTQQLTDLVAVKWSGVYGLLSNPLLVGWTLKIEVVHLEIWRQSPSWYKENVTNIGGRMGLICKNTMDLPFDYIFLETHGGMRRRPGVSWVNTICNPRWRCSVGKAANLHHMVEAHELGHSMGLNHDHQMPECDKKGAKGFMSTRSTVFRDCYATVLNRQLRGKHCLFRKNVDTSLYNRVGSILPLYRGQFLGLDDQCKLTKGEAFEYFPIEQESLCKRLTCIRKWPFVELSQIPTFLGTPCGKEHMCYYKSCVPWINTLNPNYLRPLVVNSTWGPWSEFTSCDNTCGEAVSVSTRRCHNQKPNLAPYCSGDVSKARTCPSRPPCAGESTVEAELLRRRADDVCTRAKVSSTHHNLSGEGTVYGGIGEFDKCTVSCKLVRGIPTHRYLLPDGTPCWGQDTNRTHDSTVRGISWKCVQGRCMVFGCNGKTLGEGGGVEADRCRKCGGDGSSCAH